MGKRLHPNYFRGYEVQAGGFLIFLLNKIVNILTLQLIMNYAMSVTKKDLDCDQ